MRIPFSTFEDQKPLGTAPTSTWPTSFELPTSAICVPQHVELERASPRDLRAQNVREMRPPNTANWVGKNMHFLPKMTVQLFGRQVAWFYVFFSDLLNLDEMRKSYIGGLLPFCFPNCNLLDPQCRKSFKIKKQRKTPSQIISNIYEKHLNSFLLFIRKSSFAFSTPPLSNPQPPSRFPQVSTLFTPGDR